PAYTLPAYTLPAYTLPAYTLPAYSPSCLFPLLLIPPSRPFPLPVYSPSCLFPELPVFISFLYQFIEIININSKLKINTEFNSKKPEGEFRNWETIS
ncbi:hypothetical protein, partial [Methanosarcina mazei]